MKTGLFVSSNVLSSVNIYKFNLNSKEFKDFLVKLSDLLSKLTTIVNLKTSGLHPLSEFITGETYFPGSGPVTRNIESRPVTCMTINFGALPDTNTKSVAHGITFDANTTFVESSIMSTSTSLLKSISIPHASATAIDIVEFNIDNTNVSIKTGKDMTDYDKTIIVLKYISN